MTVLMQQTLTPVQIVTELERSGLCIVPNYLSITQLSDMRADFELLRSSGSFQRAGVGPSQNNKISNLIRHDSTYWWDENTATAVQQSVWTAIHVLQDVMNAPPFYLGIRSFNCHYALYPEGGFYRRHRDTSQSSHARVVSFIIYLNSQWREADGGKLRIFNDIVVDGATASGTEIEVAPLGGSMVCFLSDRFDHEVLLNHKERFSLAGWFTS